MSRTLKLFFVLLCVYSVSAKYITRRWKPRVLYQDQNYWRKVGQDELQRVLHFQNINKAAKNVILFLGDGMSLPTITAGRIYKNQKKSGISGEEGHLNFDMFPHTGLAKTYTVDKQVPDSASTGTAYLAGVKTNYKTIGVDATAKYQNCSSLTEQNKVFSIAKWSLDEGKKAGIVTTARVTHATPAATYAHVVDRDWECDAKKPTTTNCKHIKDIGRQLVEDYPGNKLNVIMGGGYSAMSADWQPNDYETMDKWDCMRGDKKNLPKQWLQEKGPKAALVRTLTDLKNIKPESLDYLMGIFSNSHIPYDHIIKEKNLNIPTISQMTEAAIKSLRTSAKGYFLLVEGGRIDMAHHDTLAHTALDETAAMDDAIETALSMVNLEETLIIVTADHTHTMTMNGYPQRGSDILGFGGLGDDDLPYMTLMYANGMAFNQTYKVEKNEVTRVNLTGTDFDGYGWARPAAFPRDSETHGGEDVIIYATGPMSHLFNGVHEQNYIAHAMAYASCVGENKALCNSGARKYSGSIFVVSIVSIMAYIFHQCRH